MNDFTSDFDFSLHKWMVLWLIWADMILSDSYKVETTTLEHYNTLEYLDPNTPYT